MPGVVIKTGAVAGPSAPTIAPASTYFAVGLAERGATDAPVLCRNFAEFERNFGTLQSYGALWDNLKTFFEEGGTRAYVARVVGPAATIGTLASPLMDSAATPVATLNVSARSAGAWSSRVSVQVLAGVTTDTFRIRVFLDGDMVGDYANLHSPAEAVSRMGADPYIKITDAGSTTVAPGNNPAPTANPTALAAGTDDRASVTATHYTAALDRFDTGLGDGAVAIPGIGVSVHTALIAHADATNRIALLTMARNTDQSTLVATAASLDAIRAGLFAPWVRVPDGFGGTRTISPEGYVAACRARAHGTDGPWQAPAGELSKARYLVGLDQAFTATQGNDMDAGKVNVIRTVASSVRLYGWRSLAADEANWGYLSSADTINRIVTQCYQRLEPWLFAKVDGRGHLLSKMEGSLVGVVKPMADADGLFPLFDADGETMIDPGYKVNVSSTLNTTESLALNQVLAELGVRVVPLAAMVYLTVTKAAVTAAL